MAPRQENRPGHAGQPSSAEPQGSPGGPKGRGAAWLAAGPSPPVLGSRVPGTQRLGCGCQEVLPWALVPQPSQSYRVGDAAGRLLWLRSQRPHLLSQ